MTKITTYIFIITLCMFLVANNRQIAETEAATGQICTGFANVDFFGGDFYSANGLQSMDECCSLCNSPLYNTRCQAWTYEPASLTCYLKSSIGALII
jgi:hypothetical protein